MEIKQAGLHKSVSCSSPQSLYRRSTMSCNHWPVTCEKARMGRPPLIAPKKEKSKLLWEIEIPVLHVNVQQAEPGCVFAPQMGHLSLPRVWQTFPDEKIKAERQHEGTHLAWRSERSLRCFWFLISSLHCFIFIPSCPLSGPPAVSLDFPGVWNKPCNWGAEYADVGGEIKWGLNK